MSGRPEQHPTEINDAAVADWLKQNPDFLLRHPDVLAGIIISEYGQTAGIVTLEDAIETLLGVEIVDEFDVERPMIEQLDGGRLRVNGRAALADLTELGQRVKLASGGNGGFGNLHYKSSTNRAPRHANPGLAGVERQIWLRLKLIADVGLLGLPNAGKSTFLAATSNARPKIADYPFTTLHPNLGVVGVDDAEFVVADIPGLIEGAHEGKGIGDRFLGHVERSAALLHLVDGTSDDVAGDWQTIITELKAYGGALNDKGSHYTDVFNWFAGIAGAGRAAKTLSRCASKIGWSRASTR